LCLAAFELVQAPPVPCLGVPFAKWCRSPLLGGFAALFGLLIGGAFVVRIAILFSD